MTIRRTISSHLPATSQSAAIARMTAIVLLGSALCLAWASTQKKSVPAPKPAAKASAGSLKPPTNGARSPAGSRPGAARPGGAEGNRTRTGNTEVRGRDGSITNHNARGGEVTRSRDGHMSAYKDSQGREAKFGNDGRVREVHGNGMDVYHGPRGTRRTVVERNGERRVAYGHGRGYISHSYSWHGHSYYGRTYYRHGGYYRAYYHPYYYHGVYLHGYMPAYYYPPVYYGWAYNPWPAPVVYSWGWAGNPWYGYYGPYFAPYPVYPSAAYWITDYTISASLADAYAAGVAAGQAGAASVRSPRGPRLVYASYSPDDSTAASPVMTKAVKDAVAQEINRELAAAQKVQDPSEGSTANLATLLADGQPHVFVVNTGLSVSSSGQDCGITEGDVLSLASPPAESADSADLQVLASKQGDCSTGATVSVGLDDLQEMQNHLLQNIDDAMAQMKNHPGQGGLPAPPAAAIQGTTQAPYASAAPPPDPNGAAELDQQAQQGDQLEQQVVADASTPDQPAGAAPLPSGAVAPAPARPSGPITIALGQTQAEVIAGKGQPLNIVKFPTKTVFIYSDMKVIFVGGKVSDVQ